MLLIFLLLLSLSLSTCENTQFSQWKHDYNKLYRNAEVEQQALSNWLKNKEMLDEDQPAGWQTALGKYADMSELEFSKAMLMRKTDQKGLGPKKYFNTGVDLSTPPPSSFDWRYDGNTSAVTSVKDQGFVGTCWAFSTIENIEGQWALAGNELTELSPEYLVDCDGSSDEVNNHADCSIFGGWPYLAYDFIIDKGGLPSEEAWPYCAGDGSCFPCMLGPVSLCGPPPYSCDRSIPESCKTMEPIATISSWMSVSSDEEEMAQVLVSQGPLSVLIDATGLQHYKSGIWDGKVTSTEPDFLACSKTYINHAVLVVGYGEDSDSGTKYWTVKNSWGEDWGEEGFFRITRGDGTCAINTQVTTSLVK